MKKTELVRFLRHHKWAVEATLGASGPQAAVIGFAVTDHLEIVFDTSTRSRKAENLRRANQIALVVGWDEAQTVQIEGTVEEIGRTHADHARLLAAYVAVFADGAARAKDPDITHFCVRPAWARYSDFRRDPEKIEETRYPA